MRVRVLTLPVPRALPRIRTAPVARARVLVPLRVDVTWLLALGLGTWTLADAVLPAAVDGGTGPAYWAGGFLAALGLGISVALHEAAHCWAARRAGLGTRGVVLSAFGGVAHFDGEPASPRAALSIAVAGPAASLAITVVAGLSYLVLIGIDADPLGAIVVALIAVGNALVALVNVVPARPLDGGHALRALLWAGGLERPLATRLVRATSHVLGFALVGLAVIASTAGEVPIALWTALLGLVVLLED